MTARRWHRTLQEGGNGSLALGQPGGQGPSCSQAVFWGDPHHHGCPPQVTVPFVTHGAKGGRSQFPSPLHRPCPTWVPCATHGWGHCVPLQLQLLTGAEAPSLAALSSPRASLTFSTGMCCPRAPRYVYLKKKKKKARLRGRKGLPKPCEATRLTTWLKGNSPAITQLGEMFSRRGSPTFPCFLPASTFCKGKSLVNWGAVTLARDTLVSHGCLWWGDGFTAVRVWGEGNRALLQPVRFRYLQTSAEQSPVPWPTARPAPVPSIPHRSGAEHPAPLCVEHPAPILC